MSAEPEQASAAKGHTYARPRKKVMISSTARDLPEHREQVIQACLRMDCTPLPMETLTAADATAVEESLRLVDEADLYIGIFAHRYGFVPPGYDVSITELEYDRACQRRIPRLVFFMHDEHPLTIDDVETGPGADKLKRLKDRIGRERVAAFFKSPADLRAHAVQALSRYRESDVHEFHYVSDIPAPPEVYVAHPYTLLQTRGLVGRRPELNWLTDWVAGPGGRSSQAENDGLERPSHELELRRRVHAARMVFLVAIGGLGKSALGWSWFDEIAPQEMRPLAGRMWWSFYESDASFENFVIRGLAYVSQRTIDEVRRLPPPEREAQLLATLDREPFLLVLDGLERLLIAYSGANASRLADDELDQRTAHYVARAYGLPETAAQTFTGQHRLRLTADPRAGSFLRRLTHVRRSRVLVTTRLYPADLQTATGEPVADCFAYFLRGLSDDDALDLWRVFGARGSRETMLPLLATFDKHPLLVQALASVVAHDRRAVGDFDRWRALHPDFNPFPLLHAQRKTHVLAQALRGLDDRQLRLLQTVAAFRMPTTYGTLAALLVKKDEGEEMKDEGGRMKDEQNGDADPAHPSSLILHPSSLISHPSSFILPPSSFSSEPELDAALGELEDRGLVGWDRRANRYDLHPIVRGVVWSDLDAGRRRDVFTALHDHFSPIATPDWENVESLDDLTPAIELFHTLIELERYEDAFGVFQDRLDDATLWRLSASRLRIELVERLFPDGVDQPPRLSQPRDQSYTLNALAQGYQFSGQPGAAVPVFRLADEIDEREKDLRGRSVGLCNLSNAQRLSGDVRGAEASARAALRITREQQNEFQEGVSLYLLGLALAVRNASPAFNRDPTGSAGSAMGRSTPPPALPVGSRLNAVAALERSLRLRQQQGHQQGVGLRSAFLAEVALWSGDAAGARTRADRAWELAAVERLEADFIRAARLQGTAAVRSLTVRVEPSSRRDNRPLDAASQATANFAHERLHHALTRARACQLVEEELPTLIALAELHWLLAHVDESLRDSHSALGETGLRADPPNVVGSPTGRRPPAGPTSTPLHLTPAEHLDQARRLLDDVWDRAVRGPYPTFHADALNLLAQIERTAADPSRMGLQTRPSQPGKADVLERAKSAALSAYEKSWLQGPPFAYAFGLYQARQHLAALGAPPPTLPPYDESQYDPMPDIEIDPPAEPPASAPKDTSGPP